MIPHAWVTPLKYTIATKTPSFFFLSFFHTYNIYREGGPNGYYLFYLIGDGQLVGGDGAIVVVPPDKNEGEEE